MALKRRRIQRDYLMAMQVPQESAENKYLGHRMLFTLENQRSHRRKVELPKLFDKNNYETNALSARCRAIKYMSDTIAETKKYKIPHIIKFELDLYVMSLIVCPVIMLRCI